MGGEEEAAEAVSHHNRPSPSDITCGASVVGAGRLPASPRLLLGPDAVRADGSRADGHRARLWPGARPCLGPAAGRAPRDMGERPPPSVRERSPHQRGGGSAIWW